MRLAGLILTAALVAAAPAHALSQDRVPGPPAGSVPVTPLGPDEVLLELEVTGVSRIRGDVATIVISVGRSGGTPAEARAEVQAEVARIGEAARKAGLAAADVRILPGNETRIGFIGNEVTELLGDIDTPKPRRHFASSLVEIRLRNPRRLEPLRAAVETAETEVPDPVYALAEADRGSREARADALRRARAEAEDYARSLGLRVGRLVRVGASSSSNEEMTILMRMMNRTGVDREMVETNVLLSAAFALVPNR